MGPAPVAAGTAPPLQMHTPESARGAVVSGGLATLTHVGAFAALLALAWLAPAVVEEVVIPVKIIQDLPGSNEPAPAPKAIAPRSVASAAAIRPRAVATPQPLSETAVSAEALRMDRVDPATTPAQVAMRQVVSRRVDARSIAAPRTAPVVDVGAVAAVDLHPTDLSAPAVEWNGPREVVAAGEVAVTAPQAFADLERVADAEYTAEAEVPHTAAGAGGPALTGMAIDTGVASEFLDGAGTGGSGSVVGATSCMESVYVQRYLAVVKDRTEGLWKVPDGTAANEEVVLGFDLDVSGSPTRIEVQRASDPVLGRSAIEAMRMASPFPGMDDNVRCLAAISLRGPFTTPL